MKCVRCPICLDPESAAQRQFALVCGHVFCEPCLSQCIASQQAKNQALLCPTCRCPFRNSAPEMIELFFDYEDDEQETPTASGSSTRVVGFTEEELNETQATIVDLQELGVESSEEQLETAITKTETLTLRLDAAATDQTTKEIVPVIMDVLKSLRGRLVFAARLASLKSAHDTAIAEHAATKADFEALKEKYGKMKYAAKQWQKGIQDAKRRESQLEDENRKKAEKMIQQTVVTDTERATLRRELEESRAELNRERAETLKWKKKYVAMKQSDPSSRHCSTTIRRIASSDKTKRPPSSDDEILIIGETRGRARPNSSSGRLLDLTLGASSDT